MYQAWVQHPGFFVLESLIILAALCLGGYVFLKNRDFRNRERLEFLKNPQPGSELFFSAKLLKYIPWQFWTSLGILILILICYFAAGEFKDASTARPAFLDLIKTVTGAVIGSLFGKGISKTPSSDVPSGSK